MILSVRLLKKSDSLISTWILLSSRASCFLLAICIAIESQPLWIPFCIDQVLNRYDY